MKNLFATGFLLLAFGLSACQQLKKNHESPEDFEAHAPKKIEERVKPEGEEPLLNEDSRTRVPVERNPGETGAPSEIMPIEYNMGIDFMEMREESPRLTIGKGPSEIVQPRAGTLTAGEINDFSKWELWNDLTENSFQNFSRTWGFTLKERYSVQLTFPSGLPAVDVEVNLVNEKNEKIFTSRTDNTGKAELWGAIFGDDSTSKPQYSVSVKHGTKPQVFKRIISFQNGINNLKIKGNCKVSENVDIAFVVDATGSMGDEIQYLKTELLDVLKRVKNDNPGINLRTGSVFYRDHGDAYLTQHHNFSTNLESTIQFIQNQSAAGGGDFPEAVDDALDVALNSLEWSEHARARLLFLVLDAPPHQNPTVLQRMKNLVQKAALLGVRIIPVTGSGINKDVEFLMRSMALATNGTYTFLTNHSGVGGKHIEPSTDNYEVEKLNDLLVRLINRYATVLPCEQPNVTEDDSTDNQDYVQNPNDSLYNSSALWLKCYPNPSYGPITFEVNRGGGFIYIFDNNGKLVVRIDMSDQLKHQSDIRQLASGYYFVVYEWQGSKVTRPIVLRSNLS